MSSYLCARTLALAAVIAIAIVWMIVKPLD